MKFYTRFNPPMGSTLDQTGQVSKTRQSEMDNCDINKIMERFNREGKLPVIQTVPPRYGDARTPDFQTAKAIIIEAEHAFQKLPSATRKHFNFDPGLYMEAILNPSPEQAKKLLELGVIVERQATEKDLLQDLVKNTTPKKEL